MFQVVFVCLCGGGGGGGVWVCFCVNMHPFVLLAIWDDKHALQHSSFCVLNTCFPGLLCDSMYLIRVSCMTSFQVFHFFLFISLLLCVLSYSTIQFALMEFICSENVSLLRQPIGWKTLRVSLFPAIYKPANSRECDRSIARSVLIPWVFERLFCLVHKQVSEFVQVLDSPLFCTCEWLWGKRVEG